METLALSRRRAYDAAMALRAIPVDGRKQRQRALVNAAVRRLHAHWRTAPVTADDFHLWTSAEWRLIDSAPDREPDFVSASGSRYWLDADGVIRQSDHWGPGIASCDWHLEGCQRNSARFYQPVAARCAWTEFQSK